MAIDSPKVGIRHRTAGRTKRTNSETLMPSSFEYGVAIDAGSTGSRIYLYRWPKKEFTSSQVFTKVEEQAIFSQERTPGITDSRGNGLRLLEEMVVSTKAALPSDVDPIEVPIYLGATAGMRIIDPAVQTDIMSRIRSLLSNSGFLFHDGWARIISGEEEAIYDWLAGNYLKNKDDFLTHQYGALDLGGASTQISFISPAREVQNDQRLRHHKEDTPVRISKHPLFAQSFLHYGIKQARIRYNTKIGKINPCYPSGFTDPISNISGSSNWDECLQTTADFFDDTSNCYREGNEPCLLGERRPPVVDNQTFIAMSAFFYTWDYFGLKTGTETEDLAGLRAKARVFCNLPLENQIKHYQQRIKNYPPKKITARPYYECFAAAYTYNLLSKGYGMPVQNTPIEIHFDINGTKAQWALGLMIVAASAEVPANVCSLLNIEESACLPALDANGLSWIIRGNTPKVDAFRGVNMISFAYLLMIPSIISLIVTLFFIQKGKCHGISHSKPKTICPRKVR